MNMKCLRFCLFFIPYQPSFLGFSCLLLFTFSFAIIGFNPANLKELFTHK